MEAVLMHCVLSAWWYKSNIRDVKHINFRYYKLSGEKEKYVY